MNKESGQTLIETLVACFVLVMGITAALTLATYSLNATNNIKQKTIALGLSREGIEVVKNIRDTNWFKATLNADCYDFLSGDYTAFCYQEWLNPSAEGGQDISASGGPRNFRLIWNEKYSSPWFIEEMKDGFGLDLAEISDSISTPYYYSDPNVRTGVGNSGFHRAITITEESSFAPFDQNTGPRIKVTSHVWWEGKNCPESITPPEDLQCSVKLETYLTNWKNY